jgi:TonB family protein
MAASTTTDFINISAGEPIPHFSLIQQRSLVSRLLDEITRAAEEFARDPYGFIKAIFSLDEEDPRQRKRLYIGLSLGVALHAASLTLIVMAGWHRVLLPVEEAAGPTVWLHGVSSPVEPKPEPPKGNGKGGGGGGQNDPLPAIKGTPPPMAPRPQIVAINPSAIQNPSLPVQTTLVGPTEEPPPPDSQLGDPNSKGTTPSGGPGAGGGVGPGAGTGIGKDSGPGAGPGTRGGRDGGPGGSPNGIAGGIGPIDWSDASRRRGFTSFRWVYRARPIITPEAQANKSSGVVLLKATFGADGVIRDIRVVQPVDYMTEAAIKSLERCRFSPATLDGVPITLRNVPVKIPVTVEASP